MGIYTDHERKVKELLIDMETDLEAEEVFISAPGLVSEARTDYENSNEEKRLFYDEYSERFFKSKISQVAQAEYHLNRNFALKGMEEVNTWYTFLGIPLVSEENNKMWIYEDGICWIDFSHEAATTENGVDYFVIRMLQWPEYS